MTLLQRTKLDISNISKYVAEVFALMKLCVELFSHRLQQKINVPFTEQRL